jgi:predicted permease
MLNDLLYRLRALFGRAGMEAELDDELRFHFEREVEKYVKAGMNEDEARRRARMAFGGQEQMKEDCRDARGTSWLEQTMQDVRYALRQLWATKTFAVTMILTLALAIGANSAIFSVVESVLIRPLAYPRADRMVRLFLSTPMYPRFPLNPWDFHDFRDRSKSFSSLAAFTRSDMQLSGGSERPEMVNGFEITAGYFDVLGIRPELGHEFDRSNEVPNSARQVILSDRLWRTRFAAAADIIGKKITLNAMPFTVVGVMPAGMEHPGNEYHPMAYGRDVDVWCPFWFEGNGTQRGSHYIEGIGRLKDGVTVGAARGEMNAIMQQIGREHSSDNSQWQVLVVSLNEEIVGTSRPMLLVLLGAVGMVLLIACANAANLLLARAASRGRELAVRLALGAPRLRLVRQLMTESLIIALAGGALGLALAAVGERGIVSLLPIDFPRVHDIHVSAAVFGFTLLISAGTGILFGLFPALQASRTDPRAGLHEGGRTATGGRHQQRMRSALVMSEVTLACALLIGAGLMLRSLLNQLHLNPGFREDHVLTATLSLPVAEYKKDEQTSQFYKQLLGDLQAMPGVEAAGAGSDLPWTGWDENSSFDIEGKQPPPNEFFHGRYHAATPDYFRALGTPLVSGRFFTDADKDGASQVILINEAMAKKYWPHEDAVGKRMTFEDHPKEKDWLTVVGVVGDVKDKPGSAGAEPGFWWPHQQVEFRTMAVVVRSSGGLGLDPRAMTDALRNEVHRLNPGLALAHVQLMDEIVQESVATPRMAFVLVGLFGALAILLATIGTYGVISYAVSQRTAEFGLRMALGAQRGDLLRLVLGQGARLVIPGAILGVGLALGLGRVMKSLIYGVSPADPLTFVLVAGLVLLVALLASYFPARRAAGADPMRALRAE